MEGQQTAATAAAFTAAGQTAAPLQHPGGQRNRRHDPGVPCGHVRTRSISLGALTTGACRGACGHGRLWSCAPVCAGRRCICPRRGLHRRNPGSPRSFVAALLDNQRRAGPRRRCSDTGCVEERRLGEASGHRPRPRGGRQRALHRRQPAGVSPKAPSAQRGLWCSSGLCVRVRTCTRATARVPSSRREAAPRHRDFVRLVATGAKLTNRPTGRNIGLGGGSAPCLEFPRGSSKRLGILVLETRVARAPLRASRSSMNSARFASTTR